MGTEVRHQLWQDLNLAITGRSLVPALLQVTWLSLLDRGSNFYPTTDTDHV